MPDTVEPGINLTEKMLGQDVLIASVSPSLIDYPCACSLTWSMFHYQRNRPDREWKIYHTVERADPFDLDGRRVVLFDTPGFDDTNRTETEILRTIALELEKQYRKGQTLHGIIYVHRISDFYVNGLAKTNLGIFRKLCGDSSLQNVVIMTNMWSRLHSESEGRRRTAELASMDDFFKPAIADGAVMMHHMQSTVESARTVIRQILKNHPIGLSTYEEIVDQHKNANETGIGVEEKLAQLELKQFEAAEQARKELLEQAERIRQLQETFDEEKRNQARQYQLLQEQFADAERKREQAIREVEERSRREIQAAEASIRDGVIVSGRSYAMFNQRYESYYATLDDNEEHVIMESRLDQGGARQQWRFYSEGKTKQCMLWRIQSVSSGKYLCSLGKWELKACKTTPPSLFCTRSSGHDSQFR
ncbi:hypothetical protein H1R20_g8124, partial [Candolleomyces eurysporus]